MSHGAKRLIPSACRLQGQPGTKVLGGYFTFHAPVQVRITQEVVVEIWTEVVDEHGYRFPVKDLLHATGGVDFQPYLCRVFALWWLFPVVPDSL